MSSTPESDQRVRVETALGVGSPRDEIDLRPGRTRGSPTPPASTRPGAVAMVARVGPLRDVVTDLRRAVLLALGEDPLAVVCDLSAVLDGSDADAGVLLAAAGQQVRDWPAVPVAMPCPDPVLRGRLSQQPMSEHVLFYDTVGHALAAVRRVAAPTSARRRLAPQATASRLARDFVSRTCLDWGLAHGIASACLVVSELVNNGLRTTVADMDLALAYHDGLLRLALRGRATDPPNGPISALESISGRGLALVEACSRSWGVLPTADGGKVVWAVLDT